MACRTSGAAGRSAGDDEAARAPAQSAARRTRTRGRPFFRRAAGVFFHEIFGHRVEASRQRNADDGQTFVSRIGEPILPTFLSVVFDPTVVKHSNVELMGTICTTTRA